MRGAAAATGADALGRGWSNSGSDEANRTSRGRSTSSSSRMRRSASSPLEFRGAKFSGGKIERRKADGIFRARHAGQEVVFLGAELRVSRGARRDHARDFALDQLLGDSRVLHLLADGDLESFADELGDVVFGRVVGHAAHGDGDAFFLVARGQRDLQLARGDHGVLEEELVEIAQAKEEQRVGMLFLDRGILPHQRSGGLAHRRNWRIIPAVLATARRRGRVLHCEVSEAILHGQDHCVSNAANAARGYRRKCANDLSERRRPALRPLRSCGDSSEGVARIGQLTVRRACGAILPCSPMPSR